MICKILFGHLRDRNVTYFNHMFIAFHISYRLLTTGVKSFVHGIFPFVYVTSATDTVNDLHTELNPVKYTVVNQL